eukprot:Gregarina_sp_Poly_1__1594@NODE_1402_length_4216_cov_283_219330_g933_i0_p4_GENE_NODE_1402_length_4216_cov_283_219330_g933_i0NODE_1402_length_4216_cov_283_219330_g933_i0_p4_ORF_typecomplete_len163_score18_29Ribosomal_L7Ae/PF01248_26/6_4e21_NODE_1402_length_4216_cov_283_219330_g933_i010031491
MGKPNKDTFVAELQPYMSPIANPLFHGKLLERSLKLIRKTLEEEKELREKKSAESKTVRFVRRGVAEVTKSIRKGERGLVFLASDVYPADIIAHLPVLCEQRGIVYGYLGCKDKLGAACHSKRPTAVLMICLDEPKLSQIPEDLKSLYTKVQNQARKNNPYL